MEQNLFIHELNILLANIRENKEYMRNVRFSISKTGEPIFLCRGNNMIYAGLINHKENTVEIAGSFEYEIEKDIDRVSLCSAEVSPNYQGRGLARCLMDELENIAKENNLSTIYLSSLRDKTTLYHHLGFRRINKREHTYLIPMIKDNISIVPNKSISAKIYYTFDRKNVECIQKYNQILDTYINKNNDNTKCK